MTIEFPDLVLQNTDAIILANGMLKLTEIRNHSFRITKDADGFQADGWDDWDHRETMSFRLTVSGITRLTECRECGILTTSTLCQYCQISLSR